MDRIFHNPDLYPTPEAVIAQMLNGFEVSGKIILEPSAGTGAIVDYLKREGAEVIAVEKHTDLRKILATKCKIIGEDFLQIKAEQISHINGIAMNPPFSNAETHILHAWEIAPAGCTIIALCNLQTVRNTYSKSRERLAAIVEENGSWEDFGQCFEESERRTGVEVACIRLKKPADNYSAEFEGFFLNEEPEFAGENGIMPYNSIRDLVNRYVEAVKLFDKQMELAEQMNNIAGVFFTDKLGYQISEQGKPKTRNDFKKEAQKSAWKYVFQKMNMQKHTTKGLREDINKFVEQQTQIPFTMKNVYRMIELVIGTTGQRMDKAILEVFNKLTEHYHGNRYHVEGWKTNSHYLVNKRFIFPYGASMRWGGNLEIDTWRGAGETLIDFEKALCFLTAENYDTIHGISQIKNEMRPGQWHDTHFLKIRAYKKGTIHCEFKSEDVWGNFNQRIAKIKGFPLYEAVRTKETPKRESETAKRYRPEPTEKKVLFELEIN